MLKELLHIFNIVSELGVYIMLAFWCFKAPMEKSKIRVYLTIAVNVILIMVKSIVYVEHEDYFFVFFLWVLDVYLLIEMSWYRKAFFLLGVYAIGGIPHIIIKMLLRLIIHTNTAYTFYMESTHEFKEIVFINVIYFVIMFVFCRFFDTFYKNRIIIAMKNIMFIVTMSGFVCVSCILTYILGIMYNCVNDNIYYFMGVCGFCIFIVVIAQIIYICSYLKREEKNKYEAKLHMEYIDMQQKYCEQVNNNYEKVRVIKHDISGHLSILEQYCNDENMQSAIEYLHSLKADYLPVRGIQTNNEVVDILLNNFSREAEQKDIKFTVDGNFNIEKDLKKDEWCSLFYNIVKNALEAAEKADTDKFINIKIRNVEETIIILIENSVAIPVTDEMLCGTSKDDKENHGIGLSNVEYIVHKYGGVVECENMENDVFRVKIIIY